MTIKEFVKRRENGEFIDISMVDQKEIEQIPLVAIIRKHLINGNVVVEFRRKLDIGFYYVYDTIEFKTQEEAEEFLKDCLFCKVEKY